MNKMFEKWATLILLQPNIAQNLMSRKMYNNL